MKDSDADDYDDKTPKSSYGSSNLSSEQTQTREERMNDATPMIMIIRRLKSSAVPAIPIYGRSG